MALNRVLGLFVCGAVLGSLLLASGCGDSGPGSASGGGTFEGNWVMAASETGNRAIDKMTKENFGNYHKDYAIIREGEEYFFAKVTEAGPGKKHKLTAKGDKLVQGEGISWVEYELKDGNLVATYYMNDAVSHKVTYSRK